MAEQLKPEAAHANVISFAKRKPVPIEPELKKFLDECVIPMLIREALAEIPLESERPRVPHSTCGEVSAKAGVR
jgi:hypothetical protein